ncbi:MAG: hypothetical protein U0744_07980 [Gemmataceae bacterium]
MGFFKQHVQAPVDGHLAAVSPFCSRRALGHEALGLGDADLMLMMAGAFLNWQLDIVGFS